MSEPLVCAVMLACGRQSMCARAADSFDKQTYQNRKFLVYGNDGSQSIGALRNAANALVDADIILHWDSDDYSHPRRIEEQVALLQSSGAPAVGYRDMLFWDTRCQPPIDSATAADLHEKYWKHQGEAWVYTNQQPRIPLGTSLCYWRKTWEGLPFRESGCEYHEWCLKVKPVLVSCYGEESTIPTEPGWRMIAQIHGGNSSSAYKDIAKHSEWRRAPEWTQYAERTMRL